MTTHPAAIKAMCLALCISMTGCASMGRGSSYVPLVDTQGKDASTLAADVQQCQAYATQRANAETGAIVGAVALGLLSAFLAPSGHRNYIGGRGAVVGAIGGASGAGETQEAIIKRCLAGRGYNVLN